MPRLIPVLDLRHGQAVRAVRGDRANYQPLRSVWAASADPIELAEGLCGRGGFEELYIADLDAIESRRPHAEILNALGGLGVKLWLDLGIRGMEDLDLPGLGTASSVVVGLETLRGPDELSELLDRLGSSRLVLSVDLDGGNPRCAAGSRWSTRPASWIVGFAVGLGVRRCLLLDLSVVGTGRGLGALGLLKHLGASLAGIEWSIGGGMARGEELLQAAEAGAAAVLVGAAIHDGIFKPGESLT